MQPIELHCDHCHKTVLHTQSATMVGRIVHRCLKCGEHKEQLNLLEEDSEPCKITGCTGRLFRGANYCSLCLEPKNPLDVRPATLHRLQERNLDMAKVSDLISKYQCKVWLTTTATATQMAEILMLLLDASGRKNAFVAVSNAVMRVLFPNEKQRCEVQKNPEHEKSISQILKNFWRSWVDGGTTKKRAREEREDLLRAAFAAAGEEWDPLRHQVKKDKLHEMSELLETYKTMPQTASRVVQQALQKKVVVVRNNEQHASQNEQHYAAVRRATGSEGENNTLFPVRRALRGEDDGAGRALRDMQRRMLGEVVGEEPVDARIPPRAVFEPSQGVFVFSQDYNIQPEQ